MNINCAAIMETLLESELFGHEKGAFTGAHRRKDGRFQQAHGGSLFLDEISEMSLAMQVKFLRVLQEREITYVGSEEVIPLDVRITATTNKDLLREIEAGRFWEDLYYRLNVVNLNMLSIIPVLLLAMTRLMTFYEFIRIMSGKNTPKWIKSLKKDLFVDGDFAQEYSPKIIDKDIKKALGYKDRAREMLKMVNYSNKNFLIWKYSSGREAYRVNCWLCHRGKHDKMVKDHKKENPDFIELPF